MIEYKHVLRRNHQPCFAHFAAHIVGIWPASYRLFKQEIIEGFKKIVVHIAPPPFIIPLFMRRDLDEERRFVNNVLAVYTLVTIVAFTIYFTLNPVLG